ncbi:MAG: zf-HC2 domain-containing protein [Deltaproteobacteria bacterium]|jgi:anti-sigma factor (TIGR02949 family)|nr:zf-HC2 domain-containing protein [Deltaproteobacteria bacterium]MBW1874768.1 zf-HC2 domain-containing protein [Deltaproteobacteria bacterium]MBW2211777.1 zf-HC2 domain-containing protein [Deltaproteobacteria bacterium]MBW2214402.1 zf-HC2 domain-containing protein [Deltaproteobacteria bacterium]MBW2380375.1 zf-HC2 domain-containing protein [Deltaproteobacteria bacterium]
MSCKLVRRHLGAFVDGELDPATQIEFERHLEACPGCQEHLAFEGSLRQQTRDSIGGARAPEHLWGRTLHRLDEIDEARADHTSPIEVRPMRWRQTWPIAAAAAAVLIIGGVVGLPESPEYQSAGMLQDVMNLHSQALPSDVQAEAPQEVVRYFKGKTPFPVKPAKFEEPSMKFIGARYIRVGSRPAAALYYNLGGHRVTLLVFQSPEIVRNAQRTHVGGREIYYHDVGGNVVTIRQQGGVNYAFFGDIDRRVLFRLAANARVAY